MSPGQIARLLCLGAALVGGDRAVADTRPRDRDWVSMVVTKISEADRKAPGNAATGAGASGSVTIRVRIGVDGSLDGVAIEEASGSPAVDERAIRAVRAASPFRPPPAKLLSLEGYVELSFPLQFDRKPIR